MIVVAIFLFGMEIGNVVINNYTNEIDIKEDNLVMAYDEVRSNDDSTQSDYVKFDAYFLQGSKKTRGISSELNSRPELQMYVNVLTNGRLENGKIILRAENYEIVRKVVADNVVSSMNGKTINLKTVKNGTYKSIPILMEQSVVGNSTGNKNKLSKINSVTFTGIHIAEDGTRTTIEKTVNFQIDWYGSKRVEELRASKKSFVVSQKSNKVIFEINSKIWARKTADNFAQAPDKAAVFTATLPTLNGYAPSEVIVTDASVPGRKLYPNYYNYNTRQLNVREEIILNENGEGETVGWGEAYDINITIVYPYAAYNFQSTRSLTVTINGYLEGYNNPNSGYTNPVKSAVASQTVNINLKNPQGDLIIFETKIEDLAKAKLRVYYDRYVDSDNGYRVVWNSRINYAQGMDGLIFEEDADNSIIGGQKQYHTDHTQATNGMYYSLDGIVSYVGIKVPETAFRILGNDGFIKIINSENGSLVKLITSADVNKYIDYDEPVEHIRIETSKPITSGNLIINNYKNINNEAFINTYDKNQFNAMNLVYTSLNGKIITSSGEEFINRDIDSADYIDGSCLMYVDSRMQLNTQAYNNKVVTLSLNASLGYKQDGNTTEWLDPIFILEYPSEVDSINIKGISCDDGDLQLQEVSQFTSGGKKCVKIKMSGVTKNGSNININHTIRMNPKTTKSVGELRVFSYNKLCDAWHSLYNNNREDYDTYDIDENGITSEKRFINFVELIYSKPSGLYTNMETLEFDSKGTIVMGPDVADVEKTQAGKQAKVRLNVYNNYNTAITNVKIVGKIPFKNNTYQINGNKMGSNFTAIMGSQGIILPNNLRGRVNVWYSTKEKVNSDLSDLSNGWTQTPDWSQVKTYLIDMSNIAMNAGESYTIDYIVKFPDELNYGLVSYATHAIYFDENTPDGKVSKSTEPNKVGFSVSSKRNYNLQITKLKQNSEETIKGIKYKVIGPGLAEGGTTYTTNANGIINISKLFPEETYTIEETYATGDYIKNENILTLKTYFENGELKASITGGTVKNVTVENGTLSTSTVKLQLENEPKYSLEIDKYKAETTETIRGVSFTIKGEGFPDTGKKYTTDANGQIKISGLIYGKEYSIQETSTVTNYILNDKPIIWVANRENTTTKLDKIEADVKSVNIEQESAGNIAKIKFEIENEPKYELNIRKFKTNTDEIISGAVFNIKGEGFAEGGRNYTTDKDGNIKISGLVPDAEYILQETKVGVNYRLNDQLIKFKTYKQDGELKLELIEGTIKEKSIVQAQEGTFAQVTFDIENDPNYELNIRKSNRNTGEKISGTVFNIKGTGITEDGKNYITDEEGNIKISGLIPGEEYTLQETKANESYILDDQIVRFTARQENGLFTLVVLEGEERLKAKSVEQAQVGTFPQVNLDIDNEPKYDLNIRKFKKNTEEKVANVTFKIKGLEFGEEGKEYTTDENGNIKIIGLTPDEEYVLQESVANENYVLDNQEIRFKIIKENNELKLELINGELKSCNFVQASVGAFAQVTFDIENEPRYNLEIVKYKKGTTDKVKGVTFTITGEDSQANGKSYVTDEDGIIRIYNLIYGKQYQLEETATNDDYIRNEEIITWTASRDGTITTIEKEANIKGVNVYQEEVGSFAKVQFEVENEPKYELNIQKYNQSTNENVPGVIFNIKGEGTSKDGDKYTTDINGNIKISKLVPGAEYVLQEIKANDDYVIDESIIKFKAYKDNDELKLVVSEKGSVKNEEVTQVKEGFLPQVTFRIENEARYDLNIKKYKKKTNETIDNTTFIIKGEGISESGDKYTTDEDGYVKVRRLIPGVVYTLQETEANSNYMPDDITMSFKVTNTNGVLSLEVIDRGNIRKDTLDQAIIGTSAQVTFEIENEPKYTIRILKTETDTNVPLQGIVFIAKGKNFQESGTSYTTDKDGMISIEKLELGETYTLYEDYAKGYKVDRTEFTVKVERVDEELQLTYKGRKAKEDVVLLQEPNTAPVVNIAFENDNITKYDLELTKKGEETGALLSGVGFDIEGRGRDYLDEKSYITGEDGKLLIKGLYVDETYKLTETTTAAGYKGFTEPISFKVIEKEDGTWEFEDPQGNLFKNVDIDSENKIVRVDLENEILFRLQKVDEKTGEPLEGAKYVIRELDDDRNVIGYAKNVNGEEVGQLETIDGNEYRVVTTNEKGLVIVELAPGFYEAEEIQAPLGYDLPVEKKQYFGIEKSKDAVKKLETSWSAPISGAGEDTIERIVATSDGGFLVGGYFTSSFIKIGDKSLERFSTTGSNSSFVAKYTSDRNLKWAMTFGTTKGTDLKGIIETKDGGFAVVGTFSCESDSKKIMDSFGNIIVDDTINTKGGFIIKYRLDEDNNYVKHWEKITSSEVWALTQSEDGKILCSGLDGFIAKYEDTGEEIFVRELEGDLKAINKTKDGGFITTENLGSNVILRKYNSEGTELWKKEIINVGSCSIAETTDGEHYLIGGYTRGTVTLDNGEKLATRSWDGFVISYNKSGKQEWGRTCGAAYTDFVHFIVPTKDNGIVALGSLRPGVTEIDGVKVSHSGSYEDSVAIKYDSLGNTKWAKVIGGNGADTYTCGAETIDGNIIAGISNAGAIKDGEKVLYNKTTSTSNMDSLIVELVEVTDKAEIPDVNKVEFKDSKTIFKIYTKVDGENGEIAGNRNQEYTLNESVEYKSSSINDIEIKPDDGYFVGGVTINDVDQVLKKGQNIGFILDKFDNVSEDKYITVKFTGNPAEVIVHHIDKETGNPLVDDDYIYGETDKDYTTSAREDIPKYRVIPEDTVGETSGKMLGTKEVTYYYTKKDAKVTVHYYVKGAQDEEGNPVKVPVLDSETGEMTVVEDDVIDGKVDEHYETTPKDIKNYRLVEEELPANAEGEMTEEPIEVIYYYELKDSTVIVHHYEDGTTIPVAPDDNFGGKVGDSYTSSPSSEVSEEYELVEEKRPVNETVTLTEEPIYIIYYYTKRDTKVIVHHYKEETTEKLAEDVTIDGKIDSEYNTHALSIKDYAVVDEEPENFKGKMTKDTIEVTYYYRLKDSKVIVHHYEDGTTIPVAPDDNFGGKVGDSYTSSPSSEVSEEYELVEEKRPVNETVTLTEEPIEIIYYYTKRATKVIVHHYKEGTIEKLAEDVTIDGKIDSEYDTHALSIKDYVVVDEEPENFKGKMTKDTIEVIYYYRLKDTKVTVHHYKYETKDDEVPESVAPDVIQEGKVGTYYVTEPRRDLKEYRVLEEEWPSNADGYMTEEPIEVIYYYVRKDASVIVHHYLDGTTEQVADDDEFNGKVGDTYTSAPKTDLGEEYELVEEKRPENPTVTLTEEPIEIIYYYRLIEFKITTEVEGEGGTISGQEDEVYEVVEYNQDSTKEIVITPDRNYRVSKITINGEDQEFEAECNEVIELPLFTEMKQDKHIIVSFEKVNAGTVTVRYLDIATDEELIESITLNGEIDDPYETDRVEIENYNPYGSDPINKDGFYAEEEQEVIYYYERAIGTVTIKYVDIDSDEELAEQQVMGDYVGEEYNTLNLRKEIDKYELVEEELPKEEGTYINGNIDVVYKYRRIPSRVIVKYLEKGTELELAEEIIVTGIEDDPYDVHDLEKTIKAYERTEDIPDNVTGEMTEQDIIVKYYYKRIQADFVENDINKEGTKKLAEKDQLVLYDISYNAEIANYLGNATVTIVDYLPYEIDLNESDIKDGNYNPEDKTITWVDTIEDIDTYENSVNRVIEITKQIKVKYINMDYSVTSFENKVKGKISLDTTKQEKETPEKIAVTETNFYKDIVVTKNWDHTNNIYGKPKAITVKLMVGEEMIDSQTLTSANKAEDNFLNENKEVWKCTFENVRKYDNLGNEINYTIDEDITEDLKYYETSYDQANATITNTYIGPVITRRKEQVTENNLEYVVEGEKITYRIVVENSGKIAKDVSIQDDIPDGLKVDSIKVKNEATGEVEDVTLEALASGIIENVSAKAGGKNGRVIVTIEATVKELPNGQYSKHIENTATVDGEDTETVETNVNKSKIIGEKSVKPEGPVQVGQELTYSINVKNIGTLEDEVIITDSIPDGTTYVPGSVMFGNKTYTDEELIAGVDGITLEKSIDGLKVIGVKLDKFVLDAGKNITLSFKAKVNANVENEEKITNTAYVNEVPTTTENTVIKPIIEIKKLLKEINGQDKRLDYVFRGDTITYEIQAKNTGDLDGTVIIKDEISENAEFVSGSIKINGVPMNYTENDLLNGIEVSVPKRTEETPGGTILSFTVKVKGKTSDIDGVTGDVKNIATWKYKNPLEDPNPEDPDTSREYETDEVKVPIVVIEKKAEITRTTEENQTLPENTVTAKDEIKYTIVITNTGTSATGKFVVKDDIPEGTTILNSNGGTISDKTISWTIDNLPAKEEGKEDNKVEISFTVTVKYAEVMPEKIVNIAYVNDKPTNETETPYVKLTPKMETEIVKTGDDITMAGNKVYYKMTYTGKINDFAGKACVTIVDELPYRIDKDKSELNGGKYEEDLENKKYTITWKLPAEEINTYVSTEDYIAGDEYVISAEKEVWLYYTDNLGSEFTNKAIATTQLKEPDLDNPGSDKDVGTPDIAEGTHKVTVKTAYELPVTGRNGTTIFAIIGLMIVGVAVTMGYKAKRKDI